MYYGSLNAVEEHETTWAQLETELNGHLSQLVLVLYGAGDPALDFAARKGTSLRPKGRREWQTWPPDRAVARVSKQPRAGSSQ
jgi:hypothetical protein